MSDIKKKDSVSSVYAERKVKFVTLHVVDLLSIHLIFLKFAVLV
jgi:hypothetical protein